MGRLTDDELKQKVTERGNLKVERDKLTGGLSVESLTANPMAILTKMDDLKRGFEMTQKIESISDEIVTELILLKTGG